MASPITWRNINAPSFASSNALAIQASRGMVDSLKGLSDVASGYGDTLRDRYTNDGLQQIAGLNDANAAPQQISNIVANLRGVDMERINQAGQDRTQFLQSNQLHPLELRNEQLRQEGLEFDVKHQEEDRLLDRQRIRSNMETAAANKRSVVSPDQEARLSAIWDTYSNRNEDGTLSLDDPAFVAAAQVAGVPLAITSKYMEQKSAATGLTNQRSLEEATIKADRKTEKEQLKDLYKEANFLESDFWQPNTDELVRQNAVELIGQLSREGYKPSDIKYIMNKGKNAFDNFDINRGKSLFHDGLSDIEKAKRAITPK